MVGKGMPVGEASSQSRSGPACWNPAWGKCSKDLFRFCMSCFFSPFLTPFKMSALWNRWGRSPPSLTVLPSQGIKSDCICETAGGLLGDWGLRRPGLASSLFRLSPYWFANIAKWENTIGLTARPNLTIGIELCKISQAKPLHISIWLTHARLENKQTAP